MAWNAPLCASDHFLRSMSLINIGYHFIHRGGESDGFSISLDTSAASTRSTAKERGMAGLQGTLQSLSVWLQLKRSAIPRTFLEGPPFATGLSVCAGIGAWALGKKWRGLSHDA